ncbi:ABC transporter ATP-binding protein [Pseudodesulfovibrio sediminis]|uniref:ABC transporter n=1 Tax=Pseudodesulfovibrio sediminis TaxID=2810563 RepID=A0ABN6EWP0_9BACT|nr:ABC transporter ATP-binding protein [Pseudodesulfovibrio sediminis]BCS89928.1 ABC transporter [Pseudodesulfovibrio sediminis]
MDKLRVHNVSFGYNGSQVLRDISFTLENGSILSLLGPNGSGKTTLLKILLGLYPPHSGQIFLDDVPITELTPSQLARKIAYVPQTHRLSFAYSVFDVVLMGRAPHASLFSRYSMEDRDIAMKAMERLSISKLKDRSYTEISGGERQLTLIGRALAQGADTLVMDEPLNGLDYGNQIRLLECIKGLSREGYTFIKTTHFPDHALWISNQAVLMYQGEIVADGPTQSIINEGAISALYKKDIAILDVGSGVRTCMPRSLFEVPSQVTSSPVFQEWS